jgi:N-acetylneuraminate synthase
LSGFDLAKRQEVLGIKMQVYDRSIARTERPFIIAEISGNHMGDFQRAMDLVGHAAETGVDAVKLQTYRADTITMDSNKPDFQINDEQSLWNGRTLYDLYDEAHTPWEWHEALFEEAKRLGIQAFSTPFDETAVDLLENLQVPCYKVASFEHTFVPLLKKVAATNKPVIVSCGLASIEDITETYNVLVNAGAKEICLLSCTSSYPAAVADSNLRRIPEMAKLFPKCQIGLSDHTIGSTAAITAVALGATVIEKHLKLAGPDDSVDGAFSATPREMKEYVDAINDGWDALGVVKFGAASEKEKRSEQFRRSIYVVEDIKSGEIFTKENIRCIRPGFGLHTKYYEDILGKQAEQSIERATPLTLSMVDGLDD